jgi:hypothetical protein
MTPQKPNDFRVHALAILAVRRGRELGEQLAAMCNVPTGDLPRTSLAATRRRLEVGQVTDGRDLVVFEALQTGLAERMSLELIGSKMEPQLVGHDEDGEIWASVEVPVYSDLGQETRSAYERLERFLEVRKELIDHANAERLARQLLR